MQSSNRLWVVMGGHTMSIGNCYSQETELEETNNDLTSELVTVEEVMTLLKTIDTSKSSGLNNMNTRVYKDAFLSLPAHVTKLLNASLQSCKFPMEWKKGTVIPLPKITPPHNASDLRPISLLPLPGKLLERFMSKCLSCYLDEKAILSPKQHGFRKGKSTQSSISALLCDVYDNINKSLPTFLVFLDMKKAFDTVSHSIILDKLKKFGLGTRTIKWFSSYLGNRK